MPKSKIAKTPQSQQLTAQDYAHTYLLSYAAYQFPGYQIANHHKFIAKHLELVEKGKIKRLMIFMPPRHGKSLLTSEFFPGWYLGRNPNKQIIAATYAFDRAGDTGRKVRNQIVDPAHKEIFPACSIALDQKGANKLSTDQGGVMFSVGIGGAITGRGADILLIDDPIKNREDAESEASQRKLRDWFQSVAYTRLMPGGAIILIMTRWHHYDLAAYLLEEKAHENWIVLNLPAIATKDDIIGRVPGEALWPAFYDYKTLMNIKATVGTREWNALYQQQPIPEEGGIVKLDWFKKYSWNEYNHVRQMAYKQGPQRFNWKTTKFPFTKIVCSWDTAFKEKELNDPSAVTIWGITETDVYLLWAKAKRLSFPKLRREVIHMQDYNLRVFGMSNAQCPVLIEDRASGQSLIQDLKKSTNIPIIPIKADANKQIRLSEVSAMIEAGRVYVADHAPWVVEYETEMAQFPFGKHDDMVDSTSQFLRWCGKPRYRRSLKRKYWK